ncbi:DNA-binding response OmpR family regulator [Streptomyces sp. B3I7]|nr:DNA-binding response OmpR family regulator [Streptomyces sp. B3I7]
MRHKILVVEDDHALRDVLRRGLLDEDFEPVLAADGATALKLATDSISAVVLDVGLPDADGRDVCQALRANGFAAPIIFLTARHHLTDRLSGFSAGADDYLPKPFHLAELVARLRAALKRAGPQPWPPPGIWSWTRPGTVRGPAKPTSTCRRRSSGCWPRSSPRAAPS